jgi:hypothetical protein
VSAAQYNPVVGTNLKLSAQGLFSNGAVVDLTNLGVWTATTPAIASVSAQGQLSALATGTATIQFSYGGQNSSQNFTVTAATLNSISITPGTPALAAGSVRNFTATGFYSDGQARDLTSTVTWASSQSSVATVQASGSVSALVAGSTTISAQLGAVVGSTNLIVNSATLTGLDITPAFLQGPIGIQWPLKVMAHFSNGTSLDVTTQTQFTAADPSVASVSGNSVSFLNVGQTLISASYMGQSLNVPVNSLVKSVTGLSFSVPSLTLPPSVLQGVSITATYSDSSTEDVTAKASLISSNPSIVNTSSTSGQIQTLAIGSVNLTAGYGGQSASLPITVSAMTISLFSLSPGNMLIPQKVNVNFHSYAKFSNGVQYEVTPFTNFVSSAPAVFAISNSVNSVGFGTNLGSGTNFQSATVTGSYQGQSSSSLLTINPSSLTSITLSPQSLLLNSLQSATLRALGKFSDGGITDLTSLVLWSSSDSTVGTVSNLNLQQGQLTALNDGAATISATLLGVTGTLTLTVADPGTPSTVAPGLGLKGSYYANMNLAASGFRGSRIDSTVNFNWQSNLAPLGLGTQYSIEWTGFVQAKYSETYTICTISDDGVRLWINGVQLVNNWTDHAQTQNCGNIVLTAGQKYSVTMDFYQNGGLAVAELYWQSPSQTNQPIPQQYLFDH